MSQYLGPIEIVKSLKTVSAQEAHERIARFYRGRGILLEDGIEKKRFEALGLEGLRAVAAMAAFLNNPGSTGNSRSLVSNDYMNRLNYIRLNFGYAYPENPADSEFVSEGKDWFALAFRRPVTSELEAAWSAHATRHAYDAYGKQPDKTRFEAHSFLTYKEYLQSEVLKHLGMESSMPESTAVLDLVLDLPRGSCNGRGMENAGQALIRFFEDAGHDIDKADHKRLSDLFSHAGWFLASGEGEITTKSLSLYGG